MLSCDGLLDLSRLSRQSAAEQLGPVCSDDHHVLNAYAEILFGDVNSRLYRDHHTRFERRVRVGRIMDFESQMVAQAMREVLAQRLAVQVLAVGVDVIVRD